MAISQGVMWLSESMVHVAIRVKGSCGYQSRGHVAISAKGPCSYQNKGGMWLSESMRHMSIREKRVMWISEPRG